LEHQASNKATGKAAGNATPQKKNTVHAASVLVDEKVLKMSRLLDKVFNSQALKILSNHHLE
jgi:hypothetical protein